MWCHTKLAVSTLVNFNQFGTMTSNVRVYRLACPWDQIRIACGKDCERFGIKFKRCAGPQIYAEEETTLVTK